MFISIDIGGTNTRVASSEDLKNILDFEIFPSQQVLTEEINLLEEKIKKVSQGKNIEAIILGVAGIIDTKNCVIIKSPNYSILNGIKAKDLIKSFGTSKIYLLNDTVLAAFGEAVLGAGIGYKKVAYLALGTGVGGAFVYNGKIDVDRIYEPGHQIVNFDAESRDGLGVVGSLETFISGTAFQHLYGMYPHECTDPLIWSEYGKRVAMAINNLIFMWDVDCVVIGGGMSKHFDKFYSQIALADFNNFDFITPPKVLKAKFEQGSGISGGFAYLFSQKK